MSKVLLVYTLDNVFGTPTTHYDIGDIISGGGKVLVNTDIDEYSHVNLLQNTIYYYRLWTFIETSTQIVYSATYKELSIKTNEETEEIIDIDNNITNKIPIKKLTKLTINQRKNIDVSQLKNKIKSVQKGFSELSESKEKGKILKYSTNTPIDVNVIKIPKEIKEKEKEKIISTIMGCMFKSTPKELIPSNPKIGGLPALIDMFVDVLMKAIEEFAKQFFYFKNTIDKLVGLELGDLLSIYVPGLVKVLSDLKILLSDPGAWMMKTLLDPLFDINIPIPKMELDIGTFIPMLPFKLKIPEIDPFNYFNGKTPFNPNILAKDIPGDWLEQIQNNIKKSLIKDIEESTNEKNKKISNIDKEISEISDRINNINKYTNPRINVSKQVDNLYIKKNNCDGCDIDILCEKIDTLNSKLDEIIIQEKNENIKITSINIKDNLKEILKLKDSKEILINNKVLTKTELKKKVLLLSYTQKIKNDDLDVKISKIYDLGVDIYDNENLEILQKLGFNLASDKYIIHLKSIKSIGVSLSNNKLLTFLYELGFNFNDPTYMKKINKIKEYINLNSTNLLLMLDIGFNLSNNSFDIVTELKKMDLLLKDKNTILKLQLLGFNFNNPHSIIRLKKLSKYIDVVNIEKHEIILKNININNPYYLDILKKSYSIGLRWMGEKNNYLETEQEILLDKDLPKVVDYMLSIINNYKRDYLSYFHKELNYYSKYGIMLDFSTSNFNVDIYVNKLKLLREFNVNKGWIKDGVRIDSGFGSQLDYDTMVDGLKTIDGEFLVATKELNHDDTKISYDVLRGIYENFNELGLNNNDPQFKYKFDKIFNNFKITIDSSVMLNTTKVVTLTYTDIDKWVKNSSGSGRHHPSITIDLSKNKVNPDIYTDERYKAKINIKDISNKNYTNQPTKSLVQFETLQKLGFNFQNDDYYKFIDKFTSLNLNLKKVETKLITDSLISIGWHWSKDINFNILNELILNGFSYNIMQESTDKYISQMYSKLEHLNTWGFNFNKLDYNLMLRLMGDLGIKLNNQNFDDVVENLIGIGISLNDIDWKSKLDSLLKLKMNFSNKNWKIKLDNLQRLGVDFYGVDWNKKYNKIIKFKKLGIDYSNIKLNEKISILNDLGVDFSKNENDWLQKLNSLEQLNLVNNPTIVQNKKDKYILDRTKKVNIIENKILELHNLNENPTYYIDKEISKLFIQLKTETDKEKCKVIYSELNEKENQKRNILNININYDGDIKKLENEKNNIPNISYKYNKDLIFQDISKFKIFKESGIDFFNKDYENIINSLVDVGLDFSLDSNLLKNKLNDIKDLIPINPPIEWAKKMVTIIKSLIMLPMQLMMGIIEKLIKMINKLIGIPLNPTKIPEWSKEVIVKFQDLISMIKDLPTLDGLSDILFMSENGMMLIDIYIPGFAKFMSLFKSQISQLSGIVSEQSKNIKKQKENLNKIKTEIQATINISSNKTKNENIVIKNRNILSEQTRLLNKIDDNTISKEETSKLNDLCSIINTNEYINMSEMEIKKQLDTLNKKEEELKNTMSKNIDALNELKNTMNIFDSSFCSWGDDIDNMINGLKTLIKKILSDNNPYDILLSEIDKNIEKFKNALDLTASKEDTQKQSKQKMDVAILSEISNINLKMCDGDFNGGLLSKKNELLSKLSKNSTDNLNILNIDNIKKNLNSKIGDLIKEKDTLIVKSNEYNDNINQQLESLNSISKHLPVIINIICCTPKSIANILVEILNKVGEMQNLPNLWDFPLIK